MLQFACNNTRRIFLKRVQIKTDKVLLTNRKLQVQISVILRHSIIVTQMTNKYPKEKREK